MKKAITFLCCLFFVVITKADVDFQTLQALTNQIATAYGRGFILKSDLQHYLGVLASKNKAEGDKPSEEAIREAISLTNAYAETKHLEQMPPSKALPLYFALLENDQIMERGLIFNDGNYSNSFENILSDIIFTKLDINARAAGGNKTPTTLFFWYAGYALPRLQQTLFWYYIGLDYLPTLWEDWYKCWKLENKSEKPRLGVLKKLAEDLSNDFGYHTYPFIAEAIKSGDETFQPLIDVMLKHGSYSKFGRGLDKPYNFSDPKSFVTWWENNKED
ncbi:hypothetical protein IKZ80_04945, partial [bacterium]|nr:hypothetical protein [bacterium]